MGPLMNISAWIGGVGCVLLAIGLIFKSVAILIPGIVIMVVGLLFFTIFEHFEKF